jgi:hypothetical protein
MISILGNQLVTESYYGSDIEEVTLENSQKYERDNGLHVAIQESYSDIVGIYEAIAITDMKELQQRNATGTLMESSIVMEGFKERVKAIWEKIKEWVQKLWTKIKTFFKNLYTVISSLFMSGKQFVDKNKKALSSLSSKKVTLKNTFKYEAKMLETLELKSSSKDELASEIEKNIEECKSIIGPDGKINDKAKLEKMKAMLKEAKDSKEETLEITRGLVAGKKGAKLTNDEYQDALDVYFQGGDRVAGDVEYTVAEAITLLTANYKKAADSAYNKYEKDFKSMKSANDKFKNIAEQIEESSVSSLAVETINLYISLTNGASSIYATALSKWKKAVAAANANAKKVCVRAMIGKVDQ